MKLNFKVYPPYFMMLALLLCASYTGRSQQKTIALNTQLHYNMADELAKANKYLYNKDYDNALRLYLKLKDKYLAAKDYPNAEYICSTIANILYLSGNYIESEKFAVEALVYLKETGKTDNLVAIYNLLGILYRKNSDQENSIKYYNNAIRHTKDSLDIYIIKNNIASVYDDKKEYEKALDILLKINKSKIVSADTLTKARVLDNIGSILLKLNKPDALKFLTKGLELRKIAGEKKDLITSYLNFYDFYKDKNSAVAYKYALSAYRIAIIVKNREEKLKTLEALLRTTKKQEYNKFIDEYIKLNDSLNIEKSTAENKFAKIKYDYKDNQAENMKLRAGQLQDKLYKLLLAITVGLVLIISAFIFFIQRLRHKKAKIIEVYNTENRISKKIHDELANDVFKVMSFAESLDTPVAGQQKLMHDLDIIYKKTRNISHENNTIDTVNFGPFLWDMLGDYKTENINLVMINFETINWDEIADHKKITAYRVLQELMVNMKKHSSADIVAIKFSNENGKIVIQYNDNGVGLPDNKLIFKNGLQNAENRIFAIDGTITFETSTNGLKVNCTFPV